MRLTIPLGKGKRRCLALRIVVLSQWMAHNTNTTVYVLGRDPTQFLNYRRSVRGLSSVTSGRLVRSRRTARAWSASAAAAKQRGFTASEKKGQCEMTRRAV
ncbi:hypothetical protein BC826DRAFT_1086108 [Russula brevipes]|nr:hypothetical protein BC826DRAFT_1086108 [Russula brevipes]